MTVEHSNWDTHDNNFVMLKGQLLPHLDMALAALFRDLADRGLLAKDTHENTIRIAPPLPITRDQVDWACEVFEQVLAAG